MVTSSIPRRRPVGSLVIAILIGLVLSPMASAVATAQSDGSVVVGSSSVAFTGGWALQVAHPESVFLLHEGESALFSYAELPDSETLVTDNDELIETIIVPVVRDVDGYEDFRLAASGNLQDGTRWHSYSLVARGTPAIFLVTGNIEALPGADVLVTLLVPRQQLASALDAVTSGITLNGVPTPLSAVPVDAALGQGAPVQPASTPAPSAATSYRTGAGHSITWATPWNLDQGRTLATPEYDVIYLFNGSAWTVIATGNFAPDAARGMLLGSLGADPATIRTIDGGTDGAGSYWFEYVPIVGVPSGAFTTAAVDPAGTSATMTMYLGPQSSFADGMTQAQFAIAIDGVPVFEGVDGDGLQSQLLLSIPSGRQSGDATRLG